MRQTARREWSLGTFHNLHADVADAADRVERLLFDLLVHKPICGDLEELKRDLQDLFGTAPDITAQRFRCRGGLDGLVVFDQGMVNQQLLVLGVLDHLVHSDLHPADAADPRLLERISQEIAPTGAMSTTAGTVSNAASGQQEGSHEVLGMAADQILGGASLIAFSGHSQVLFVKISKVDKRSISEPTSAPVVMGPHEGFIEDAETNLSLVRRRMRTPRLRVEQFRLGNLSRTGVYLLYLQGVVDDLLVAEARRRLRNVDVDVVMESNILMELIRDAPGSMVPTMLRSERPDRVAGALAQGQFAIITDGTPLALVAPITLGHMLKSTEDYYQNWAVVSLVRWIRLSALLLGVLLPAFYVAIVTFHPEFIPPLLLTTIAASRENVPLPALGEVLLLLGLFEIIREAGVRVPSGIGSALTIGGTLVVGQAAVRAGIVSAPVIIITAAVVIAFFAIPDYDMVQFSRFLLYPMLFAAGFLGIFGILFASFMLAFYLASLRAFGRAFLDPVAPLRPRNWKDAVVRAPWWQMNTRPTFTGFTNPVRQARNQKPRPPRGRSR